MAKSTSEKQQQQQRAASVTRDRLPTLQEVLSRRTAAPLDLYCYYLFLQREGAEDSLDFWLDVQQHENLCRAYFKDLRKSGRAVQEDWPQYYDLARKRGSIYNPVTGIQRERLSPAEKEALEEQDRLHKGKGTLSSAGHHERINGASLDEAFSTYDDARNSSDAAHRMENARSPSPNTLNANLSPTLRALYPNRDAYSPDGSEFGVNPAGTALQGNTASSAGGGGGGGGRKSLGSRMSHHRPKESVQPYIHRDAAITRTDLIASAELIYTRYLLGGAEKEIYLPPALRIHSFPLSSSQLPSVQHPEYEQQAEALARVPDMFHSQKEYMYRQMEQDSFPRFLRAKSFGNLTPLSAMIRLGLGLLALWAGLATAFSLVFLDSKPKVKRLWIILPLAFAIMFILSHSYDLDPILVFFKQSETTPFRTLRIREPYVSKLLMGRALWVTFLTVVIVAILTVIFWAVPGHRL